MTSRLRDYYHRKQYVSSTSIFMFVGSKLLRVLIQLQKQKEGIHSRVGEIIRKSRCVGK